MMLANTYVVPVLRRERVEVGMKANVYVYDSPA
jgi:hypothetical protein